MHGVRRNSENAEIPNKPSTGKRAYDLFGLLWLAAIIAGGLEACLW